MRIAALLLLAFFCAAGAAAHADSRADYVAAMNAARKGKRVEAAKLLTKIIEAKEYSGRDLANVYYTRGDLYSQMKQYGPAIADYGKAIDIEPDYAPAFLARAITYALQKKYKEALDDIARCEFLVPGSPLPYFNRGRVYELMGRKADAIEEYRKALRLAPKAKEIQAALHRLGAK
jgi:tetratricopeptide (TPR) repeat protein